MVDLYDELIRDEADAAAAEDHRRRLRDGDLSAPHNDLRRWDRRPGSALQPSGGTGPTSAALIEPVVLELRLIEAEVETLSRPRTRDHGRTHTRTTRGNRP